MNDEEFKQRLSQVADWIVPECKIEKALKKKKKRQAKANQKQYEEIQEEEIQDLVNGTNPTTPIEIIKIKIAAVNCTDCGRHCENGRKTETKKFNTHEPHWRKTCVTCKMSQNPFTGEWDVPCSRSAIVWSDWWRIHNIKKYKETVAITFKSQEKQEI